MKQLFILMLFFTSVSFSQPFEDASCELIFQCGDKNCMVSSLGEKYHLNARYTSDQQTIRINYKFANIWPYEYAIVCRCV